MYSVARLCCGVNFSLQHDKFVCRSVGVGRCNKKSTLKLMFQRAWWLRGQDLNLRPPGYENSTSHRYILCFVPFGRQSSHNARSILCKSYYIVPLCVTRYFPFWGQFWGQLCNSLRLLIASNSGLFRVTLLANLFFLSQSRKFTASVSVLAMLRTNTYLLLIALRISSCCWYIIS